MQALKKKALMSVAALVLLITLGVAGAVAWYTRIAEITGMSFDAARFDFNANYKEDTFIIHVSDYLTGGTNQGIAPGAGGVIPIRISTIDPQGSNTQGTPVNVNYTLSVDTSQMAPEFAERIKFYYFTKEDGATVKKKIYLDTERVTGTLTGGQEQYEYLYWEWIYSADVEPILCYPKNSSFAEHDSIEKMGYDDFKAAVDGWNAGLSNNNSSVIATYNEFQNAGHLDTIDPKDPTGAKWPTGADAADGKAILKWVKNKMKAHDELDTNIGIGAYDDTFKSSNGTTYVKKTEKQGDQTLTIYAYQVAMEISIAIEGAQAVPEQAGSGNTVTNYDSAGTMLRPSDWTD